MTRTNKRRARPRGPRYESRAIEAIAPSANQSQIPAGPSPASLGPSLAVTLEEPPALAAGPLSPPRADAGVERPSPTPAGPAPLGWVRRDLLLLGVAVLCGLLLYSWRLNQPSTYVFDEILHAWTAGRMVKGDPNVFTPNLAGPPSAPRGTYYEWTHPPLSKLFMQVGIHIFGDHAVGWRVFSDIFGAVGIGLVFALGRGLFNRKIGVLAAALLLVDGLWFIESRIAMNDIYMSTFLLAAYLLFFFYLRTPVSQGKRYIWATGAALGLAFAAKWSAAPSLGMLAGLVALREGHRYLLSRQGRMRAPLLLVGSGFVVLLLTLRVLGLSLVGACLGSAAVTAAAIALCELGASLRNRRWNLRGPAVTWFGAFIVLPAIIYLAVYFQYFQLGHSLGQFLGFQREMLAFHANWRTPHPWESRWWTWPLVLKPVWYYGVHPTLETYRAIMTIGNPLIWWAFLPTVGLVAYRWYALGPRLSWTAWRPFSTAAMRVYDWFASDARPVGLGIVLIGFLGQWLPWALSPRSSFIYHMLPAVPFGCLAIAYWLGSVRVPRLLLAVYLLPVLAAFIFFYPVYTAWPLSVHQAQLRYWMHAWRPETAVRTLPPRPEAQVMPTLVQPGQPVQIRATGYAADSPVAVLLTAPNGAQCRVPADAIHATGGALEISTIPADCAQVPGAWSVAFLSRKEGLASTGFTVLPAPSPSSAPATP